MKRERLLKVLDLRAARDQAINSKIRTKDDLLRMVTTATSNSWWLSSWEAWHLIWFQVLSSRVRRLLLLRVLDMIMTGMFMILMIKVIHMLDTKVMRYMQPNHKVKTRTLRENHREEWKFKTTKGAKNWVWKKSPKMERSLRKTKREVRRTLG